MLDCQYLSVMDVCEDGGQGSRFSDVFGVASWDGSRSAKGKSTALVPGEDPINEAITDFENV